MPSARRVKSAPPYAKSSALKPLSSASAWIAWITPREFSNASAESNASWKIILPICNGSVLSRSALPAVPISPVTNNFLEEVGVEANRINARFESGRWKPIVFLQRHHSHEEIARFYRAASVCLVTSLHDGMNLVAKEFIASREDNRGALILSSFAGAAQELRDALLVNPYDVDQLARSIHQALEMNEEEQGEMMSRMRKIVLENNVYRWAANLISDLSESASRARTPGGNARSMRFPWAPLSHFLRYWLKLPREFAPSSATILVTRSPSLRPKIPRRN